jgi:hypothetical protein
MNPQGSSSKNFRFTKASTRGAEKNPVRLSRFLKKGTYGEVKKKKRVNNPLAEKNSEHLVLRYLN